MTLPETGRGGAPEVYGDAGGQGKLVSPAQHRHSGYEVGVPDPLSAHATIPGDATSMAVFSATAEPPDTSLRLPIGNPSEGLATWTEGPISRGHTIRPEGEGVLQENPELPDGNASHDSRQVSEVSSGVEGVRKDVVGPLELTREQKIAAEIADGKSPWQAHAEHSGQDGTKPFIVGFYQVNGEMLPLYSHSRHFTSERQTPAVRAGEREFNKKVINLLPITFEPIPDAEPRVMRSNDWEALPEDFRGMLESGHRPVTAAGDLYELTEEEEARVAALDSPTAHHDAIQEKIAGAENGYYTLYVGDPDTPRRGRHGVLMQIQDGKLDSVKAIIDGKKQVIELKGIGTRTGGYGERYMRTEGEVRAGAVTENDALSEFYRLNEKERNGGPAIAGIILHTAHDGERLGTVFRCSPSTVRVSFNGNEAFPKINEPENVALVVDMYGKQLAEHIHGPHPKIMDRSAHPENMLVWGDSEFEFTDYADHLRFHDRRNPDISYDANTDRPGIMELFTQYFTSTQEISGSGPDSQAQLYDAINMSFAAKGFDVHLQPDDRLAIAINKVWANGGVAFAVYKDRAEHGYYPQNALHNLKDKLFARFSPARDASGELSAEAFADSVANSSARASAAVAALSAAIPDEKRKAVLARGAELSIARQTKYEPDLIEDYLDILYDPSLPADARQAVSETVYRAATLDYILDVIPRYLQQEEMILSSAALHCPEEEQAGVLHAYSDLSRRMVAYADINVDPRKLFMLLSNPELVKDFVSLNAYKKDQNSSNVPVDVV